MRKLMADVWLAPKGENHKCLLPEANYPRSGRLRECECGLTYEVIDIYVDGKSQKQWSLVEDADKSPSGKPPWGYE